VCVCLRALTHLDWMNVLTSRHPHLPARTNWASQCKAHTHTRTHTHACTHAAHQPHIRHEQRMTALLLQAAMQGWAGSIRVAGQCRGPAPHLHCRADVARATASMADACSMRAGFSRLSVICVRFRGWGVAGRGGMSRD